MRKPIIVAHCDSCGRPIVREQAAVWTDDLVFCVPCYGVKQVTWQLREVVDDSTLAAARKYDGAQA
jgi:hypothetical protein